MPELPEVETVARGVHERIHGERIETVWFSDKPEPFKTPPAEMATALTGQRITAVRRVGKTIVFDLEDGAGQKKARRPASVSGKASKPASTVQWLVHLGMTGRLLVSNADVPMPPHTHGVLSLSSGRELRFVDPRRFGRMGLHRVELSLLESESDPRFTGTGREPLEISIPDFQALFHGRKTSIKAALLNQKLLHGVGNIYADESLFRAGIRPRRRASSLTRAELTRLHGSLRGVLTNAISLGGSSVSDYVDADGVQGFFQLEHRVYMRGGLPCLVCGSPIHRIVVAGRGTHYCPQCQH
jgi:formamidopyrimidine-DNA glycosylase